MKFEYTGCCFRFRFETFAFRSPHVEFRALKGRKAHAVRRNLLCSLRGQLRRREAAGELPQAELEKQ